LECDCCSTDTETCSTPPLHCEPNSFANQIHSIPKRERHDWCLKRQTKHACRIGALVCELDFDSYHERSFPFPLPVASACILERISYATLDGLATFVLNCTCAKVRGNQVKFAVIVGYYDVVDLKCVSAGEVLVIMFDVNYESVLQFRCTYETSHSRYKLYVHRRRMKRLLHSLEILYKKYKKYKNNINHIHPFPVG
jgi:hypothetical protein